MSRELHILPKDDPERAVEILLAAAKRQEELDNGTTGDADLHRAAPVNANDPG
jgi:hypothetical protein